MLSKAFFRDNVKFVLLDENDESSSDDNFISNENCYIEVRIKKSNASGPIRLCLFYFG